MTDALVVDRLLYGTTKGHKDMVNREQDDYNRQGESKHTHTCTDTYCMLPLPPLFGLLCTLKAIGLNIVNPE